MSSEEALKKLYDAIFAQDVEAASKAANDCVAAGLDPLKALEAASKAMTDLGNLFERGEVFLPQVVVAADAMKAAAQVLLSKLPTKPSKAGRVLIGTVEGDVHDVGKGIVSVLLDAAGFEVIDIGRDVPTKVFVEKVKELKPNIVGCSALMTVTRVGQKAVIDALAKEGIRDQVKVMVGGGATTGVWAEEIGADAWGEDGPDSVRKAKKLLGITE
ncbi:methyltransferase cognate corrinoid protein [Candidatus Hecatella orcuttiae]|jgi:trimethylamine corrinoid protein|uniref:cobalamin B12-binding domain-containing protein n=1 Tax=Candidatus Hecatella orcuttiae TaxID=1935119 RepID=UPI0028680303|nr:methyltransferase cognate corrinoid protein [Candidatus Hecatella orcuttiae]